MRKKGSLCVKILAENWTRAIVARTRAWATAHKTRTLTNTSASGCRACCSRLTKTASWKHRNHLLKKEKPSAGNTEIICWKYRNHLLEIQKPSAENTETICWKNGNHLLEIQKPSAGNTEIICWKCRNHLPLAACFQLVGKALNPNWWFGCLSIISGCFHRFLLVFRLLVGILCVLFFLCSPLRLQE